MPNSDTLQQRILAARRRLERAGIGPEEAALDADVLARHALGGWERGRLLAALRDACPPGFPAAFEPLVARRERREPSGYITGVREFWDIDIEVGPGVLVPRPETELLVEATLDCLSGPSGTAPPADAAPAGAARRVSIADVGTGSGCVAVALARWLPGAAITAIDASDDALAFARRNAARHGVEHRVAVVRGDVLDGQPGPFDAVVSNPPYIPMEDLAGLQPEIRGYEPASALDGGPDGLDVVRRLVAASASRLRPGGWLLFEFGCGQAGGVRAILAAEPSLALVDVRNDLAGIPRVAVARKIDGHSGSLVDSQGGQPVAESRSTTRVPNPESRTPNPESRVPND